MGGRLADRLGRDNVFRMAGDEFVLRREEVQRDEDHSRGFEAVQRALQRPFVCDGHELFVTASIGIALYPYDGEDVGTLVKNADCAMFRAKERGGDTVECYSRGLYEEARRRLSLERSLRRALDGDEIVLEYQPQFDLATGAMEITESFAMRHPAEAASRLPHTRTSIAAHTPASTPTWAGSRPVRSRVRLSSTAWPPSGSRRPSTW